MKVTYIGPAFDSSGYANATRNNIAALHTVGVDLELVPITFEAYKSDLGELGKLLKSLIATKPSNDVRILHCTPENYTRLLDHTKYNIGYAAWETSKLPKDWPDMFNQLDEVWVPSTHNVEVFRNSGVDIPVYAFPHTFDTTEKIISETGLIKRRNNDEYLFYSIFQWLERKNPTALLKAYLTEFTKQDNVSLVLKTFLFNYQREEEKDTIKKVIKDIKERLYLENLPRILLITDLLSAEEIAGLHEYCDCFVLPHRSEGFGIPIAEAMLAGNPTISTGYSGPVDFVQHKTTGYLTNYQMTPVYGMPWHTYSGDMLWAEPDIVHLRKLMRYVYENREDAVACGRQGQQAITNRKSAWKKLIP
jgi:glycosyltransferase involved in cell wall biosynthesis